MNKTPIRSAFVLGSSSAVAIAICRALAQQGCLRFQLLARNLSANQALVDELRQTYGAEVNVQQLDLLENKPSPPEIPGDFDLYLITAGSLGDAELARNDASEALRITTVNYSGLLPWLTSITSPERINSPGRLWIFSSVAGDRGRPSNYAYGAAKAALSIFAEGLLLRCHGKPFSIRILKAGFMATPMSLGKAPQSLCVSPASVARDLLRHPNRRGYEYLPWCWQPVMLLVRLLPNFIAAKL
ncbi:MAG: SDR family NAD(P)-dependent oxidoreductase [Synechococcus lacustris]|jgi:short-subunit dehydrogenase